MSDIAKVHDIEWFSEVPRSITKQVIIGGVMVAMIFGGFGTWAATAPLAAAVISQGSFVATGQNKVVQHFEGGIINEIVVSEGDQVTEGQALIRLDETAAQSRDRELLLRRARLEAIVVRLKAQIRGDDIMALPEILTDIEGDEELTQIVESQKLAFDANRSKMESELGLIQQNIYSFRYRKEGFELQRNSTALQLQLLGEELQGKIQLRDKGLIRNTEIKAIQRAMAEAEGQIGRLAGEIGETMSQITKSEQQIAQVKTNYREVALNEMQSMQADLDAAREQARESANVLKRAVITAPVSGTVVRIYYHTAGGVIESGKPIMEILPAQAALIIEAQVSRSQIDQVHVGQHAMVRLSALNQRTTPVLHGEVFYISADSLPDGQPGSTQEVYLARIGLDAKELARVKGFSPTPGMPAEIMIQTAERTFLSYIVKPITDSMSRAFSER